MKYKKLDDEIFARGALEVAPILIGKLIVHKVNGEIICGRITQTEAYVGKEDKACHARHGKTPRNAPMFCLGGRTYIYLCYGIHHLLNIVTGKVDEPEAVLIRQIETLEAEPRSLGPGSLTKFLKISMEDNDLGLHENNLYIAEDGFEVGKILAQKRVGIDYAAEYADKPWRFVLAKK